MVLRKLNGEIYETWQVKQNVLMEMENIWYSGWLVNGLLTLKGIGG